MKLILCLLFLISLQQVEPLPNLNFLRTGFKWITDKIGYSSSSSDKIKIEGPHLNTNYSSTTDINTVGNLLKLPVNINSLVADGLALQVFKIAIHNQEDRNRNVSKRTNLLELAKNLNLTIFVEKAEEAGIEDVLDHEGPFTLFAFTDQAFNERPAYCDEASNIKDLMKFHVGRGAVFSKQFKQNFIINGLLTRRAIRINKYQNDKVLTANGRQIGQLDATASNGVLHIINDVMCAVYEGSVIVEVRQQSSLSTLAQAINVTNLSTLLDGPSPVTLFAPSDNAFKKLPTDFLQYLMHNVTAFKEVLLYHMVPNVWNSVGLENGQKLKTIQGQNIGISKSGDKMIVNDAMFIKVDSTAQNGVFHLIDTVLVPKQYSDYFQTSPEVKFI